MRVKLDPLSPPLEHLTAQRNMTGADYGSESAEITEWAAEEPALQMANPQMYSKR